MVTRWMTDPFGPTGPLGSVNLFLCARDGFWNPAAALVSSRRLSASAISPFTRSRQEIATTAADPPLC
jgi:hypothetical protein